MKPNKVFSLLGLATKAGKVVSGEFMTERSVKDGSAYMVIVGEDASDNTKKNFRNMCEYYHVPVFFYGTKEELGHAIGKEMRASLAVIESGFARNIMNHLDAETNK